MKKRIIFLIFISLFLTMKNVSAGTLSWKNATQLSSNTFEFYLEASDLNLNYVSGIWEIENGKIIDITMNDGWINKTGNNNTFYYVHDGIKSGNYKIATIKIELVADGKTKINQIDMGSNKCLKDSYANYFSPSGTIINEQDYKKVCLSNDASLKNLILSDGTLSPSFQSNITNYTTTVSYQVNQLRYTPILNNQKAKIISKNSCDLQVCSNQCEILIEAENGDRKTYTITVLRENETANPSLSNDASLKSLIIHDGILFPNFEPSNETYSTIVGFDIESLTWNATPNHEKAKIISENHCSLVVGENVCKIIVEAEDKSQKTYMIYVTRESEKTNETINNDTSIRDLTIENGILTEEFDPKQKEYTIEIDESVKTITLKYTMNANNISYTIPVVIDKNNLSYDLVITSLNNQHKNQYHFNFVVKQKEENNPPSDSEPNPPINNEDEIDNPQTGILLNKKTILSLLLLLIIASICLKKKNIINKI